MSSFYLFLSTELCPADFESAPYLGSCYYLVATPVIIADAKSACREIHTKSRLVSIESNAEHDFLKRFYELLHLQEGMWLIHN